MEFDSIPRSNGFFKKELGTLLTVYGIYRQMKRSDKTPGKPDKIQIQSGATGEWATVLIVDYVFSVSKAKRGVFIRHYVGAKQTATQVFKFVDWENMPKRTIPA